MLQLRASGKIVKQKYMAVKGRAAEQETSSLAVSSRCALGNLILFSDESCHIQKESGASPECRVVYLSSPATNTSGHINTRRVKARKYGYNKPAVKTSG